MEKEIFKEDEEAFKEASSQDVYSSMAIRALERRLTADLAWKEKHKNTRGMPYGTSRPSFAKKQHMKKFDAIRTASDEAKENHQEKDAIEFIELLKKRCLKIDEMFEGSYYDVRRLYIVLLHAQKYLRNTYPSEMCVVHGSGNWKPRGLRYDTVQS